MTVNPGSPYPWAPGLCGGPDVPHVALECLTESAEGNDVGVLKAPPVSVNKLLNDLNNSSQYGKNGSGSVPAVKLEFRISPVAGMEVVWDTTLVGPATLYLSPRPGLLPQGSKESLVSLLEYAEEKLRCSTVVICFDKARSDRVSLLRVFGFLGFAVLPPHHPLVPRQNAALVHMAYAIQPDSDDSDSESEEEAGGAASAGGGGGFGPRPRGRNDSGGSSSSDGDGDLMVF